MFVVCLGSTLCQQESVVLHPSSTMLTLTAPPSHIFSSWQIVFHICFLLGIFPVKLNSMSLQFNFKPSYAMFSSLLWVTAFFATIYLQVSFILMIVGGLGLGLGGGQANIVGCQRNETRGPDYIYSALSSLFFFYDFFVIISGIMFVKHISCAISSILKLTQDFCCLNKEEPTSSPLTRPCLVNILPVVGHLIFQVLFHVKRSCTQDMLPSPLGILTSVLYILLDLRSYAGILVFYDCLFLYTKNILVSCIKISMQSENEEKLFKNCALIEALLLQLQDGFSYYILVHITMLVLFMTFNTYFAIICAVIAYKYTSWYKLCEIAGIVAMVIHAWMRIFYICSAGQEVTLTHITPAGEGNHCTTGVSAQSQKRGMCFIQGSGEHFMEAKQMKFN